MDREELGVWLRLALTPGVGNETARKLLSAFGLPDNIFRQSLSALLQVISAHQAAAIKLDPPGLDELLAATWNWLRGRPENDPEAPTRRIVTLGDAYYPASLLTIHDPPLMLYLLGNPEIVPAALVDSESASPAARTALLQGFANSIAIVGSRNTTPQGAANARQFAKALGQAGLTVVSGMALGIDGAAHEGALEAAGADTSRLATIAVVGTGLDRVYPKSHLELARRIARRGLILSEYPIGTPPLEANFPKRNRLIAALSKGTLVVEAALKSGSLITARLAAEQGKDVFAIPGSIHSTQSRGCHALIRQGAKLVESAQDVLEELHWTTTASGQAADLDASADTDADAGIVPSSADSKRLLEALGFEPVGLDALQARTGLDTAHLQAQLMALELNGYIARLPGGLFQRIATA
jgi:DNA processing protein